MHPHPNISQLSSFHTQTSSTQWTSEGTTVTGLLLMVAVANSGSPEAAIHSNPSLSASSNMEDDKECVEDFEEEEEEEEEKDDDDDDCNCGDRDPRTSPSIHNMSFPDTSFPEFQHISFPEFPHNQFPQSHHFLGQYSSPYMLARYFQIGGEDSLRHEVGIGISEQRIDCCRNAFIERFLDVFDNELLMKQHLDS